MKMETSVLYLMIMLFKMLYNTKKIIINLYLNYLLKKFCHNKNPKSQNKTVKTNQPPQIPAQALLTLNI